MSSSDAVEPVGEAPDSRVGHISHWLRKQSDRSLGRLALKWFRTYLSSSRNSGCAITIYASLSVLPGALVLVASLYGAGDANLFAQHLVDHLRLSGSSASLVEQTFGSASSNALAASLTMAVTFLLWGMGIGQLYQEVYARAWGLDVRSQIDQALSAVFFFVFTGALALVLVAQSELGHTGRWVVLVPAWIVGSLIFWLAAPSLFLHRRVGIRNLLPGALLATVVLGGTAAFSPLFVAGPLATNGKLFGSFGVAMTVVGYLFVMITLSLACAVFSPVWFEWRAEESLRGDAAAREV